MSPAETCRAALCPILRLETRHLGVPTITGSGLVSGVNSTSSVDVAGTQNVCLFKPIIHKILVFSECSADVTPRPAEPVAQLQILELEVNSELVISEQLQVSDRNLTATSSGLQTEAISGKFE